MANRTDIQIPWEGRKLTVWYAVTRRGREPARDFLEGLEKPARAKLYALIATLADQGEIPNDTMFKQLDGLIWELKVHSPAIRILCFAQGGDWVLSHGCGKLKKKEFQVEIEKARRIRAEHQARTNRTGRP